MFKFNVLINQKIIRYEPKRLKTYSIIQTITRMNPTLLPSLGAYKYQHHAPCYKDDWCCKSMITLYQWTVLHDVFIFIFCLTIVIRLMESGRRVFKLVGCFGRSVRFIYLHWRFFKIWIIEINTNLLFYFLNFKRMGVAVH